MIVSAFIALGLLGMGTSSTSWILDLDLGASNHMIGTTIGLHGVCKYSDMQNI